jgi:hypothetical protein
MSTTVAGAGRGYEEHITAAVEGVWGRIAWRSTPTFDSGIADLYRTTASDGVFATRSLKPAIK